MEPVKVEKRGGIRGQFDTFFMRKMVQKYKEQFSLLLRGSLRLPTLVHSVWILSINSCLVVMVSALLATTGPASTQYLLSDCLYFSYLHMSLETFSPQI